MRKALLAGAARGLELLSRMPKHFISRKWPEDPDLIAVATAAVASCRVGAGRQKFRIPPRASEVGEWNRLPPIVSAIDIVKTLELRSLLDPE